MQEVSKENEYRPIKGYEGLYKINKMGWGNATHIMESIRKQQ